MKTLQKDAFSFIQAKGEMAQLIKQYNWEHSPVGTPETWPPSLKIILSTMLNSKYPKFLFWGKDLTCFYNDAYRPSLGIDGKHPYILGMPAQEAWPEIWHIIKPLIDQVLDTGEATWDENQLVPIYRNGTIEDVYWTFSYSAVTNLEGDRKGILVTCTETTQSVLNLKMLEESEDQLRFAIEGAGLGTWDYDVRNNYLHTNRQLQEWFGLEAEDDINLESVLSRLDPKEREKVSNEIRASLERDAEGRYRCEFKVTNSLSKEERYLKTIGRAWYNDKSKEPYRYNGILLDITEQQTAEQERKNLASLSNASRQFIALLDLNFRFKYCNPIAKELLGIDQEENCPILNYIFPDDIEKAKLLLDELKQIGHFKEDIRFIDKNSGKPIWINWNCVTLRDQRDKEIIGYGSVSTHIDHAIQREQTLKTALEQIKYEEERFRDLVYNAPAAIGIFRGMDFNVELANLMALNIIGSSEDDIKGKSLFQVLPRLNKSLIPKFQRVMETGSPFQEEDFPIEIEVDGITELVYFNFVCNPVPDGINKQKGVMVIAHDVTQSVRKRKFIEESEKQFRNFVLQSPLAMTILQGQDHKIVMANKAMYEDFWQKSEDEYLNKSLLDVFPELRGQKYPAQLKEVLKTGQALTQYESHAIVNVDGKMQEFYLDYRYAPLEEIDGSISGVMVTINDVTDKVIARKSLERFSQELESQVQDRTERLYKANAELKLSVEKLERVNEELESFAYVSSHDLQEPLRKIQVFSSRILEFLEDGNHDQINSDLKRIMDSAARMRNLIDDLLAFSLATDSMAEFTTTNLESLLVEVVDNLNEKVDAAGAEIEYNAACEVQVIPYQIIQVFSNLIENSLKFAQPNIPPRISINCENVLGHEEQLEGLKRESSYCKITYVDNGIGFDKKYEKRIFDLFQRLHRRDQYRGTGIGLAIVKKIIENHHGLIQAEGKVGKGAKFTIFLPCPE